MIRQYSQPAFTSSYRSWTLLIFAVGWTEPTLDMKRSSSEKNFTMYVQTILKKMKTGKSPLETGDTEDAQEIEEKYRGSDRAHCVIHCGEVGRTAEIQLVKKWLLCAPFTKWNSEILFRSTTWRSRGAGWKGKLGSGLPSVNRTKG